MNLLTSFPTVVFTFLLAVCLVWWLLSMVLSGLDTDLDADTDGLADQLGFGLVPLPLALSLLSLGGFVVTGLLHQALRSESGQHVATGVAIGVLAAGAAAGLVTLKALSKPLGRLFAVEPAPSRSAAVGSFCKVRTLHVTDSFGDAEVTNGPLKGAIIKVRADEGRFQRGDACHIIDFDASTNTYVIDTIDRSLLDGSQ